MSDRIPGSSYDLLLRIASGGMGVVYVARKHGAVGFSRLVAVKRAHPHLLEDVATRKSILAEAGVASRLHHANVVAVQDVEQVRDELLLVMDYIEGASFGELITNEKELPIPVAIRVIVDVCAALTAVHEATGEDGAPLNLVHRDVSPQNILVGLDGVARLTDFGIAKSTLQTTTVEGILKGKLGYIAPEYVLSGNVDARADVYALGIVAWEALTRKRLFQRSKDVDLLAAIRDLNVPAPSTVVSTIPASIDRPILEALASLPEARTPTASRLGEDLEWAAREAGLLASRDQVASHVRKVSAPKLEARRAQLREPTETDDNDYRTATMPLSASSARRKIVGPAVALVAGALVVGIAATQLHARTAPVASATATLPSTVPSIAAAAPPDVTSGSAEPAVVNAPLVASMKRAVASARPAPPAKAAEAGAPPVVADTAPPNPY